MKIRYQRILIFNQTIKRLLGNRIRLITSRIRFATNQTIADIFINLLSTKSLRPTYKMLF